MTQSSDTNPTILIVDDSQTVRETLRSGLRAIGYPIILQAADGAEAKTVLEQHEDIDLVITDLSMPRLDGLNLMRWATTNRPGPVWIILSGVDTFTAAVEAIHVGAFDFLPKPVTLEKLEVSIRNSLAHQRLLRDRRRLFAELEQANRDLAGKVHELEHKSEIIRRDLERAEVIQRALLPAQPPELKSFTANALHRPGRYVGGDLYNVTAIGEHHVAFYVADATGHGVSSAMLSVLFHRRLRLTNEAGRPLPPSVVLEYVNRALTEDRLSPGLFVTVAYGLLDVRRGELHFAGAGNPPVLLQRSNGQIERLLRTGPAIGLVAAARYRQVCVHLSSGDRLLMLTDGILGFAANGAAWKPIESALQNEQTGYELLFDLATRVGGANAQDDRDDMTLLLIEAAKGASRFDNGEMRGRESRLLLANGDSTLWYGEQSENPDDRERRWLAIRGHGTWTCCDLFHETAAGLLEEGYDLVIDLSACDYLDSTLLGTLHELVGRAGTGEGPGITLCGVSEPLRAAFEELNMDRVLEAISEPECDTPALQPLSPAHLAFDGRQRVLRAHEELASLSARNREKFLAVVETIRSQLE